MIIVASTTCFLSKPTPRKQGGGTALVHVTVTVVGALWLLVDVSNFRHVIGFMQPSKRNLPQLLQRPDVHLLELRSSNRDVGECRV